MIKSELSLKLPSGLITISFGVTGSIEISILLLYRLIVAVDFFLVLVLPGVFPKRFSFGYALLLSKLIVSALGGIDLPLLVL